ncbi:MAG TPA: tetratricopeptide repeat protein [Streptosporangiaceae bacterium]|nr:tetratricopeptide repeat protein [Streptosporangiaceae bacterium]
MQQPRDFSLYGAVDLGARQAALKRRQAATQGPVPADGQGGGEAPQGLPGAVIDVTEETFGTEVLERSLSVPVIIDLWADWCGPCKQLSPVLEKLAVEAGGRWVLAKIDTEANQQLSAALRVESIPMVMVAIGGQLVPGFVGAIPEPQVRQWIDQVMAEAQRLGFGAGGGPQPGTEQADALSDAGAGRAQPGAPQRPQGPGGRVDDPDLVEAQEAMERGDLNAAEAAFGNMLAKSPGNPVAKLGLSQVRLVQRVNSYDQSAARKAAAEHPADVDAQIRVTDIDMAMGRIEEAFDRLMGTIKRTTGEDRDRARVHLLSLFDVLPPRDPRVAKARTKLSGLLF